MHCRQEPPSPKWVSTRPVTPDARPWAAATVDMSQEDEVGLPALSLDAGCLRGMLDVMYVDGLSAGQIVNLHVQ